MKNIANFLFEAGMLKRTPRTGFQFLGSGAMGAVYEVRDEQLERGYRVVFMQGQAE